MAFSARYPDAVPRPEERGSAAPEAAEAWRPLAYFSTYRATLAGLVVALVVWGVAPRPLGHFDLVLFRNTAFAYLAFALLAGLAVRLRRPAFSSQVFVQVFTDILALTLLMHASGGVRSGFGMLLVVAVAGGSILARGRIAILFAALATLAVLTQQIYDGLTSPLSLANYPHAGMLGATFFAAAYLAYFSARRIRASEALAARREVDLANLAHLNEHIIQRMQAGIVALDPAGRLRMINESGVRLLGLPPRHLGDRLEVVAPELAALLERWRANPERGSRLFQPERSPVQVLASFAPIGDRGREGMLVFLEDATAMQQRAQRLKLASLGRLAGSIAHEIRNPLSAVSHAAQLLDEARGLAESDRRLLRIIGDNSARMNAIVSNVLELSRGTPAQVRRLDLGPWLEDFVADFGASHDAPPGAMQLATGGEPLTVRADPSQMAQVLTNLCENGLRYANGTPLQLSAGISDDTGRPFLEVRDDGPGIPEDVRERLFEPFFTTRADGTGLGLYISRELCEGNQAALNHVITDTGCCFRITFSDPRRRGESSA